MKLSDFKVGDKVRLKPNLIEYERYGGITFLDAMDKLKGKELTVSWTGMFEHKSNSFAIQFVESKPNFTYSYHMVERIFKYGK